MENNDVISDDFCKENKSVCMDYIKMQWQDIYHMQRSDFAILVVLGSIIGIFHFKEVSSTVLYLFGLTSSIFGALVARQHYLVFNDKIHVISKLEHSLGITFIRKHNRFTTQLFIYLFFIALFSIFFAIFLHNFLKYQFGITFFKDEWENIIGIILFLSLAFPLIKEIITKKPDVPE